MIARTILCAATDFVPVKIGPVTSRHFGLGIARDFKMAAATDCNAFILRAKVLEEQQLNMGLLEITNADQWRSWLDRLELKR